MICGSVLLISVVFGIVYSAIYTAQLAIPHRDVLVKTIEDVAADPNIKATVTIGSPTANYILVR